MPQAPNWDRPTPFTLDFSVDSSHIDGIGHVNNAVYVDWCQQAGWSHSLALGLNLEDYRRLDAAMVIRRADYDYILSAYAGQECVMGTWLTASDGKLIMERQFQLQRKIDGKTLLRATWQLVSVRMSNGKPRRMPPEFVQGYGQAVITAPQ
ncbi:acyl-CoA thioesterase [Zhongshania aliphaticivorans]|jgi:acyl-CoA thioester hydrolase|uniref:acyl-CoA thioesterase n=1 Tax=Zhongshania aliphaticivorans TaxID=1470434 RepID=UPI0039C90525|tara:strand:+ start:132 stop:584 length:453 start_codon:yes stop_codon:yes gene_type:complete